MIDIKRFREWLVELKESVNEQAEEVQIEGIALAVREGHIIRKLRDRRGIILCAKFPDATVKGDADNFTNDNDIVLFLLEKVSSGQLSDEDELSHYAALQQLMVSLRDYLMSNPSVCDNEMRVVTDLNIEWEYDIFGGWNGLSIGFKLEDYE